MRTTHAMRRTVIISIAAVCLASGAAALVARRVLIARSAQGGDQSAAGATASADAPSMSLTHALQPAREQDAPPADESLVAGLDLTRIAVDDTGPIAPAAAGTARLAIDAELQRTSLALMAAHHLPEGAVVLMDVATGKLLVYASHVRRGAPRDLCAEATAPSASLFKIVTAAALVEDAHLTPETKQCYSGGEQRITPQDLVDDPQRDRWCATLAGAMGRSLNAVFARLAKAHLSPKQLDAMARRFGYGAPLGFDVPVQPSAVHIPADPLDFARTAAGFWNTTLSPLEAAEIAAIVARDGESVRPSVVERVTKADGSVAWTAPSEPQTKRAISRETAQALSTMLEHTVSEGTSWRAFHDAQGATFLPGIGVAGKTGTLNDAGGQRYYTWFAGYAPSRAVAGVRQVAVAALVVNDPAWQVKANVLARDVLRAYFASRGVQGVTRPSASAVARHHRPGPASK